MPLRADTSLWYNSPDVAFAYQPVGCPGGAALATYNMAMGGSNRYRGTATLSGKVLPTHRPVTGWTFDGSTQYVDTNYAFTAGTQKPVTMLCRYSGATWGTLSALFGCRENASDNNFYIASYFSQSRWSNGNTWQVFPLDTHLGASGVHGIAGPTAYKNGVAMATIAAGTANLPYVVFLGCSNNSAGDNPANKNYTFGMAVTIQAAILINRVLSPAEVWTATRQMAYCDVNPDWSVWSRKRRYYYAPSQAGFLAAWAAHSNAQIGTGAGL